ncbi:MAG: DUF1284 domain-containing protein [Clostridiales bacterium]|nr:DUF1284 domain-containing protein [Clostridiales bacterium]
MKTYKIRAHHGMCLTFFQGKGYSGDFVENMGAMKKILEQNPLIRLVEGYDDVCAACPNKLTETCAEKASRYDREVLRRCGLSVGDTMPYLDFSKNVIETILRPSLRGSICGDCQWSGLCLWKENP